MKAEGERHTEVAVHDSAPLRIVHLVEHAVKEEAGVVDEDVDRAEFSRRVREQRLGEVRIHHTPTETDSLTACRSDLGGGAVGDRSVEVVDDDARALATKQTRRRRDCLLYTSPSPRDATLSRMPSSA